MQYSSATTMIPPGIEQVEPELEGEDEQSAKDQEKPGIEQVEPELEGEDEQSAKDEDKPVTKEPITEQPDQTKSEASTGGFGSNLVGKNFSQLAEANATYAPRYTITIKFDSLTPFQSPGGCRIWNIAAYVQGEKNVLQFPTTPSLAGPILYKICNNNRAIPIPLEKNPPVTVEIPAEPVESIYDSMPLSIFTVGTVMGQCSNGTTGGSTWPTELPEVKNALADKGSTRPYYAHTMEKITQIQKYTNIGCIALVQNYGGYGSYSQVNMKLPTLNVLEGSPNYGKRVPADTVGNPESVQVTTCTHPFLYCLTYTITCPLCLAQRAH